MKKQWMIVLFLLVISACSPMTPQEVQETAEPTEEINILDLLFQEGDLPPGLSPSQIRDDLPGIYAREVSPDEIYRRDLELNGESGGWVVVNIFDDPGEAEDAFIQFAGVNDSEIENGIGEEFYRGGFSLIGTDDFFVEIVFRRCSGVVIVKMDNTRFDSIKPYAERLDARLSDAICQ